MHDVLNKSWEGIFKPSQGLYKPCKGFCPRFKVDLNTETKDCAFISKWRYSIQTVLHWCPTLINALFYVTDRTAASYWKSLGLCSLHPNIRDETDYHCVIFTQTHLQQNNGKQHHSAKSYNCWLHWPIISCLCRGVGGTNECIKNRRYLSFLLT